MDDRSPDHSAKILLVEDDRIAAQEIIDTLNGLGYGQVCHASTKQEALRHALEDTPELALVDIRLQGEMTGVDLAGELKKTYDIAVVFVTAYSDDQTIEAATATDPYAYLVKPFSEQELRITLRIALRLSGTERELRQANLKLDNSRRQWQNTLHNLPVMVFAFDENREVGLWNSACTETTGYGLEDIRETPDLLNQTFSKVSQWRDLFFSNELQNQILTMQALDGTEHQVRWSALKTDPIVTGWTRVFVGIDLSTEMRIRSELWHASFRYLQLVETIRHGVAEIDPDGVITFANHALHQMLEQTDGSMLHRNLGTVLGAERFQTLRDTLSSACEGQKPGANENPIMCMDRSGQPIYIDLSWARSNIPSQKSSRTVAVLTDITETETARKQLQESEQRYRIISELSSDFAYAAEISEDQHWRFLWATGAIERITGYTLEEINNLHPYPTLFCQIDDDGALSRRLEDLKSGKNIRGTMQIRCKDGSKRWIQEQNRPLYSSIEGRLVIIGAARDITNEVQAETALSEERNLLRTLIDALPDVVYVKDTLSRYVLANSECLQHLGKDKAEDVLGRTDSSFLPSEHAEQSRLEEKDIIENEQSIIGEERRFEPHWGAEEIEGSESHQWYAVTKIPWRNNQGHIAGTIGLHRDITHYKEAAENIIRLSQMLIQAQETEHQRMALELHDNVAQDLAALRISWDLVSAKLRETSRNPILDQAERFSKLLTRCIQTVRNLSHDLSPVGLHERSLVDVLEEFCEEYAEYYDVNVETHFAGVDELELSDEVKINLFRITQETFNNTRRHAKASIIELKIVTTPRRLILDISDNGVGFHLQSTMQRAIQTHHMGLYSIQQRAKLIGAKATIRSAVDTGTRVRIELPLEEANIHDRSI